MQGAGSGPMRGIIPRAMEQVAAYCAQQRTRGWAYEMEVTYVEIYNEQVRDLLGEDAGAPTTRDFGRAEAQSGLEVFLRRPFPFACSVPSSRDACAITPSTRVLRFACSVAFETPSRPRSRRRATSERYRHTQVRRDPKTGRVFVDGATRRPIDPADAAAVDALVACAARHRCVASTEMNAVSSRSHAV